MTQMSFSPDWLKQFSDPYAVLGVSVSADERRISKRYREVAKHLHPDQYINSDPTEREFAIQLLTKLVNPTYQQLKQDKGRAEILATLRFRVRRLTRQESLQPKTPLAIKLLNTPASEADIFYEQAISQLSTDQYASPKQFEQATQALCELNLVYLRVKMGDPIIRTKRTGLMTPTQTKPVAVETPPEEAQAAAEEFDYAARHYERAKVYAKAGNWQLTVQELRDAVRMQPKRSEYHALLGVAYWKQNLAGMAKVHLRQALKLNPQDKLAQKYAPKLDISVETIKSSDHSAKATRNNSNNSKNGSGDKSSGNKKGGFLSGLFAKRN
jgi:tetratricopeptide (TPR) repeat protein